MEILVLKPFVVGKVNVFSGMSNDALMHREGLKGYSVKCVISRPLYILTLSVRGPTPRTGRIKYF